MRRPLEDVLLEQPDLARAKDRDEAEQHLQTLFLTAQGEANAYTAERLQELYEVTERALALAAAFPPPARARRRRLSAASLPQLVARYGGGLLLAASAPFVAETSVLLAIGCAVGAVLNLALPAPAAGPSEGPEEPRAVDAKFESLVTAADRSLGAMTAPRALERPAEKRAALPTEDVLGFLQDALMLEGEEHRELRSNAERIAERSGFDVVRAPHPDLFEIMIDPAVERDILLKPALRARAGGGSSVFGVIVRGR